MQAKTLKEALIIGSKELLADYDYLFTHVKLYISNRVLQLPSTTTAMELYHDLFPKEENNERPSDGKTFECQKPHQQD